MSRSGGEMKVNMLFQKALEKEEMETILTMGEGGLKEECFQNRR